MKTFLCVYSSTAGLKEEEIIRRKKYSFNTDYPVKVGDVLRSPSYDSYLIVARVLDFPAKYYNIATGELSMDFTSSFQYDIREVEVVDELPTQPDNNKVYATLINSRPLETNKPFKITL